MPDIRRIRANYANVMSSVAVFLALGGTSYAAVSDGQTYAAPRGAAKAPRTHTSHKKKTKPAPRPIVGPRGPAGTQGPTGPTGPTGATGATGPAGPSTSGFAQTITDTYLTTNSWTPVLDVNTGETHTGPLTVPPGGRVIVQATVDVRPQTGTPNAYCYVYVPGGDAVAANRQETSASITSDRQLILTAGFQAISAGSPVTMAPQILCANNTPSTSADVYQATMTAVVTGAS